jgi:predicted ribosomally synthesized peptide with nif11-like leader
MSKKAVDTFLKSLETKEELKKEFVGAMPKTADAARIVAFASTHGFDFTEDELEKHAATYAVTPTSGPLSDEDLKAVAGGAFSRSNLYGAVSTRLLRDVFYAGVVANRVA